jgi:hypothetical protein
MAIDKNDNIYVIWQMSTGGYFNLYISMCDYATLTWTELNGITPGNNQLTSGFDCSDTVNPPEVTVDWNNVVHIGMGIKGYVSISSIFYTNSTPGEMANWPYSPFSIFPPFQVDSASNMSADGLGPSMTVTKDNTVHFAYFGRDLNAGDVCHIGYYRSRSVTGVWSSEYKFYDANFLGVCDGDGLGCVYPSIEVAPDDTLYIVFMGNENGVTPSTNWCCCLVSKTWPAGVWSGRTWFAYDNIYGNYIPKHAIAGNNTMRILWYGTGLGVNPGVTNIYYRDYDINTGIWTPLISSNPVQLTDLAAAQYHCATFANKFRFANNGHDIAWYGTDNNSCVKFYGDAFYFCGFIPKSGEPRVFGTGDILSNGGWP